jgi:hypothetical protein
MLSRRCLAVGGAARGVVVVPAVSARHATSPTARGSAPSVSAPLTVGRGPTSTASRIGVVARFKVDGAASVAEGLLLPLEYQQVRIRGTGASAG